MNTVKTNSFLETEKISALMAKYAIPCIISLLVAALYNIVDQIFIANATYLGSYGNAANTVIFPLTVIALAIAVMIGDGTCAFVSICLGKKETEAAHKSIGNAVVICIVASVLLTAVYFVFSVPIIHAFGGSVNERTFECSKEYFFWITLGIPFYMFGQAMNPIIRSDGSPKFAMMSTLAGAVINIILDPIFIFIFKWGMMGAAIATVAGQIVTAILAIWYLFHTKAVRLGRNSFILSRVQELRKTVRRPDNLGAANPLTGKIFCADCGAKMYNHRRGNPRFRRDKYCKGGGRWQKPEDNYECSTYTLGNQKYNKSCTAHRIQTWAVNALVLETIRNTCNFAVANEEEFKQIVSSIGAGQREEAGRILKKRIKKSEKRCGEINRLMKKLYEDNIGGRLNDKMFEAMLSDYEAELSELEESLEADRAEFEKLATEKNNTELFMELAKRYTDFEELTPAMVNEFVSKIIVHKADGIGADRTQEVEIFLNYVGKIELPHEEVELTEEEKAEQEKERIRLEKKRASNRKYMARKREEIRRAREKELAEQAV